MKFRNAWLALFAAALAVPGAVRAQEDEQGRPGMIGVSFSVHSTQTDRDPEPKREVLIGHVRRGSPAEAAGVDEGDVVIRINGRPAVESFRELNLREGETVSASHPRAAVTSEMWPSWPRRARPLRTTRFGIVRRGDGPHGLRGPATACRCRRSPCASTACRRGCCSWTRARSACTWTR